MKRKMEILIIGTFGGGLNIYKRKEDSFERINEKLST